MRRPKARRIANLAQLEVDQEWVVIVDGRVTTVPMFQGIASGENKIRTGRKTIVGKAHV